MPLINQNSFLYELLTQRRRAMGPGNRAKSKGVNSVRINWLYPSQYERAYYNYIRSTLKPIAQLAYNELKNNLNRWLEETKVTTDRLDQYDRDWEQFQEDLLLAQDKLFGANNKGNTIAFISDLGNDTNEFNINQFQKFMKIAIGEAFIPDEPWVQDSLTFWKNENFKLIKSLSDEYIKKLNIIVTDGIQTGKLSTDIMKQFRVMDRNMSVTRARLLARDQIGKLNGTLTKNRQQNVGIEMYIWQTANDERVRTSHRRINQAICRWDRPDLYSDDYGKTWKKRPASWPQTIPGAELQCRCSGLPMIDPLITQIDEDLKKEREKLNIKLGK